MTIQPYLKLCYRLLGSRFESSTIASELSSKLYQADINMSGSMFLSALIISSLLLSFTVATFFSFYQVKILPPFGAAISAFFLCIGAVYFQLTSKIQNKRLAIDHELPFALSHMSLMASTGASPMSLIRMVASSDHGAVSTEFKKILHTVDIQGKDVVAAIMKLGRLTPSLHLRSLLIDVTRIAHTGGNMEAYFHDRLDNINELKRQTQKELAQALALYSEMYITIISVGVIMGVLGVTVGSVLMGGRIGPFSAEEFFNITVYFLIPMVNILFFALLVLQYSPHGS